MHVEYVVSYIIGINSSHILRVISFLKSIIPTNKLIDSVLDSYEEQEL